MNRLASLAVLFFCLFTSLNALSADSRVSTEADTTRAQPYRCFNGLEEFTSSPNGNFRLYTLTFLPSEAVCSVALVLSSLYCAGFPDLLSLSSLKLSLVFGTLGAEILSMLLSEIPTKFTNGYQDRMVFRLLVYTLIVLPILLEVIIPFILEPGCQSSTNPEQSLASLLSNISTETLSTLIKASTNSSDPSIDCSSTSTVTTTVCLGMTSNLSVWAFCCISDELRKFFKKKCDRRTRRNLRRPTPRAAHNV